MKREGKTDIQRGKERMKAKEEKIGDDGEGVIYIKGKRERREEEGALRRP